MSKITIDDVKRIADLAQLEFKEGELNKFVSQFERILDFVEQINELDTEGVSPMVYPMEQYNVFREDIVKSSIPPSKIEENAPGFEDGNIVVPKIIEY